MLYESVDYLFIISYKQLKEARSEINICTFTFIIKFKLILMIESITFPKSHFYIILIWSNYNIDLNNSIFVDYAIYTYIDIYVDISIIYNCCNLL